MTNRDQKFLQLLIVKYTVIVTIEEIEVFLILLLLLRRNVFLNLLLRIVLVLVYRSQLSDLLIRRNLRQIVHQSHLLTQLHCSYNYYHYKT